MQPHCTQSTTTEAPIVTNWRRLTYAQNARRQQSISGKESRTSASPVSPDAGRAVQKVCTWPGVKTPVKSSLSSSRHRRSGKRNTTGNTTAPHVHCTAHRDRPRSRAALARFHVYRACTLTRTWSEYAPFMSAFCVWFRATTCGTKSPSRSEALRFIDSSKSPSTVDGDLDESIKRSASDRLGDLVPQVRARTSPGVFRDMALLGLCLELSFNVLYCRTQANLPTFLFLLSCEKKVWKYRGRPLHICTSSFPRTQAFVHCLWNLSVFFIGQLGA